MYESGWMSWTLAWSGNISIVNHSTRVDQKSIEQDYV